MPLQVAVTERPRTTLVGLTMRAVLVLVPVPVPVTSRETLSPSALKLTFTPAVTDVVGLKRTVTVLVAPDPTRVNGLPDTTLKGAEVTAVPETVPPRGFDTVNVLSTKVPTFTLPKLTLLVGLTAKLICATALAETEQGPSLPVLSTELTAT
jgi:hypothetical protein